MYIATRKYEEVSALKKAPDAMTIPSGYEPKLDNNENDNNQMENCLLFVIHVSAPPYIYFNYGFIIKEKDVSDNDKLEMRVIDLEKENKTLTEKLTAAEAKIEELQQSHQQQIDSLQEAIQRFDRKVNDERKVKEPIDYAAIVANIEKNQSNKQHTNANGHRQSSSPSKAAQGQSNEVIDYAAIVATIEKNQSNQGQTQRHNKQQLMIGYGPSRAVQGGSRWAQSQSRRVRFDETADILDIGAYEQFLQQTGQIVELDENENLVGLVHQDDMDEQPGMERVTKKAARINKLTKRDLLMILNEDENAWEAWNVFEVDSCRDVIQIQINGGDKQDHFWLDELGNKLVYRMIGSPNEEMASTKHENDETKDDKSTIASNGGVDGHDFHIEHPSSVRQKRSRTKHAKGFKVDKNYSNCVIKDVHGTMWKVGHDYFINTSKADIVSLSNGEQKTVLLNQMPHTLMFQ